MDFDKKTDSPLLALLGSSLQHLVVGGEEGGLEMPCPQSPLPVEAGQGEEGSRGRGGFSPAS